MFVAPAATFKEEEMKRIALVALLLQTLSPIAFGHGNTTQETGAPEMHWAAVKAPTKEERTALANKGFSIESIVEETSYGMAPVDVIEEIKAAGFDVTINFPVTEFRAQDFPSQDSEFHNYAEMKAGLEKLAADFPGLVHLLSMGRSLEGREILGVRINPTAKSAQAPSGMPGIIFMGGHHAREHLSVEIPLRMARYLAERYQSDDVIRDLLNRRDIYFFPSINPDGSEFDIADGRYKSWRKNRNTNNGNRCMGVDLNRNYGYKWGTGGSSNSPCNDTFMGPTPFSEPETQAVKNFVESKPNLKILLSFHTFSELILYPWGNTYDDISNPRDFSTFKTMAETMAQWNRYTPQQSSDLYIASGDTTDWSYGTLGIFSFTFELSPKNMFGGGGFYPGQGAIASTFNANVKPVLYLIDLADDPYRAALRPETTMFYGQ